MRGAGGKWGEYDQNIRSLSKDAQTSEKHFVEGVGESLRACAGLTAQKIRLQSRVNNNNFSLDEL